jgi:FkbM family methyltransferase
MKDFLIQNNIPFDGNFIHLPEWCKRVKIDVGLSSNAPQSEVWLQKENDLIVFGFEPVPSNILHIQNQSSPWPLRLQKERINHSFFLITCALGNVSISSTTQFHVTSKDTGCSSILQPHAIEVQEVIEVPLFSLNQFLQYFPFHKIPHIEYLKTDCQGTDIEVLKGCSQYLDKICVITAEAEDRQYKDSNNNYNVINKYLSQNNFKEVKSQFTEDPTFKNIEMYSHEIYFYQKG